MTKHKWHKEIKAWADGAEIEFKDPLQGWSDCKNPSWVDSATYRIKPQPKEPQYLYVYWNKEKYQVELYCGEGEGDGYTYIGKIKLEQDDE